MQLNDSLASAYMWSQIPTNKYPIYVLFYGLKLKKNEIENEKKKRKKYECYIESTKKMLKDWTFYICFCKIYNICNIICIEYVLLCSCKRLNMNDFSCNW